MVLLINYRRHCLALLVAAGGLAMSFDAIAVAMPIDRFHLYFALIGLLHATAIAVALRVTAHWRRRLAFVAIAMALSVGAPYVGLLAVGAVPLGGDTARFVAVYVLASASGSVAYWLVTRMFWFPHLALSSVIRTLSWCVAATVLSVIAGVVGSGFGSRPDAVPGDLPTVVWWIAFSLSLWVAERQLANKPLQPTSGVGAPGHVHRIVSAARG